MALKKCVKCGIPLDGDAKSCPQCGQPQPEDLKCAHCGAVMGADMRFCPECGQAVSEGTTQQTPQAQAPSVPPATPPVQPSSVNVEKPQNAPQNFAPPSPQTFAPPQGAGAPPVQASPSSGQPMPRPSDTPPLGAQGGAFGGGAGASGAAGALGEWKEKLLSFEGRLNRKPYFLRALGVCVYIGIVQTVAYILMQIAASLIGEDALVPIILIALFAFILYIPAIIVGVSLQIRRCHDNDWPGVLVLINLVPFVQSIFGLVLLFKPGTPGPNRFGPDPLQ